jgi:hypothetical protein
VSAECSSCKAPVLWAITPKGERTPVDPKINMEKGNTLVLAPKNLHAYLAVVLSGKALAQARKAGADLRVNHWSTCPDRDEWRERQKAKVDAA